MYPPSPSSGLAVACVRGTPHGHSFVIEIDGEVDLAAADVLRSEVSQVDPARFDSLVIDAQKITFLDCGGLRLLQSMCDAAGLPAWLRRPSAAVRRIVDLVSYRALGWQPDPCTGDLLIGWDGAGNVRAS